MSVLRRIIRKKNGAKETVHLGALAKNVTQDATHRFVSDTEKQTWNGKANPEDIPSGSAASQAVANNCTTTEAGSVLDARQGKVLMDKANQLSSEIADAKQELGSVEYGTVTVTSSENASIDLKGVYKINKMAHLLIHGKAISSLPAGSTAHFMTSIHPDAAAYIPYYVQNGEASRVQMALIDTDGHISLSSGESIMAGETFLFHTQYYSP